MANRTANPFFSILLPTHNRADVISVAIQSVLAQTEKSFELFVVGDGCTDATEGIVLSFAKKDKRVQWHPFPKGEGFGYAHRNVVLQRARGTYIAFAPHDDIWFPDHLELCREFFEKNKDYSVVYTRPLWVHPDGTIVPSLFNTHNPALKHQFLHNHNEIPAQCVVHTREAMEQVGYWDTSLPKAADWDLWKRIVLADPNQRIGFIPTPTGMHFRAIWRTEQTSADSFVKDQWSLVRLAKKDFTHLVNETWVDTEKATQQEYVWKEMKKNQNWVTEVRTEVITCIDYLARQAMVASGEQRAELARITDARSYKVVQLVQKLLQPIKR